MNPRPFSARLLPHDPLDSHRRIDIRANGALCGTITVRHDEAEGMLAIFAHGGISNFNKVRAFHETMGQSERATPGEVDGATETMRRKLIEEEIGETFTAMDERELPEFVDGLIDSLYVIYGTLAVYGVDADAVFDLVHQANMRKVGGPKREDGKFLKPEGWQPPDVAGELLRQGWEGDHDQEA